MLMVLVLVFFAGTFGMNFQITSALMATQVFGKGAGEFGILGSALAVGSLAGALIAARRPRSGSGCSSSPRPGFGVAEIVAGLLPSYLAFALFAPGDRVLHAHPAQLRQRDHAAGVRPGLRGRVMALYMTIVMGGTPLGVAGHRLDRRDLRRPLDADHRRRARRSSACGLALLRVPAASAGDARPERRCPEAVADRSSVARPVLTRFGARE